MGFWVGILYRRNWWSRAETTIYLGALFRLNKYMSRVGFEGILVFLCYTDERMFNIMMVSSTCVKWKKRGTLTWLKSLISHGLIYGTKLLWVGLKICSRIHVCR